MNDIHVYSIQTYEKIIHMTILPNHGQWSLWCNMWLMLYSHAIGASSGVTSFRHYKMWCGLVYVTNDSFMSLKMLLYYQVYILISYFPKKLDKWLWIFFLYFQYLVFLWIVCQEGMFSYHILSHKFFFK